MTMIALYSGPYAPGGFIICVAVGEEGKYDWDEKGITAAKALMTADERKEAKRQNPNAFEEMFTQLVQTDWDFPAVASAFGWSVTAVQKEGRPRCEHDGTDGTVGCRSCGVRPSEFIVSAREYLEECADDGKVVEDPGYFGG